jgi:hypothetical protein
MLSLLVCNKSNNIRTKGMMMIMIMMTLMTKMTMIGRDDNDTDLIQLPMFIRIVIQNS